VRLPNALQSIALTRTEFDSASAPNLVRTAAFVLTLRSLLSNYKIFMSGSVNFQGNDAEKPFVSRRIWVAAAAASVIAIWSIPISSPLWLDETYSYWQIAGGWSQIAARQFVSLPLYSYLLKFVTQTLGTSEIAMRVPSLFAMCLASLLLYRTARSLFPADIALLVVSLFCLHPDVRFAAIDARPYAFAALSVTAALAILVEMRTNDSNLLPLLLGVSGVGIVSFQPLFAIILPFLVTAIFVVKGGLSANFFRQLGVAAVPFVLFVAITRHRLIYILTAGHEHSFSAKPGILVYVLAFIPIPIFFAYSSVLCVAGLTQSAHKRMAFDWRAIFCLLIGVAPISLLFLVSVTTSIHVFIGRYVLVGLPGVSLCWGFVAALFTPALRVLFIALTISISLITLMVYPPSRLHGYSWKPATKVAEDNYKAGDAPVLMSSDFPDADFEPLPERSQVKSSHFFSSLSYYPLTSEVVGMPRTLNQKAEQIGNEFLREYPHRRFLQLGFVYSTDIARWLVERTKGEYRVRDLGSYDGVRVLEFTPTAALDHRNSQGDAHN
jgi:hypothetical protein